MKETHKRVTRQTPDLMLFERSIGIVFNHKHLLRTALTHRSYLNENRDVLEHNERLEFLGDAVLEAAVTYHLYRTCQFRSEGDLTALRAVLVCTRTLAKIGEELHIEQYMLFSRGGYRDLENPVTLRYIRACALEAVIGAIRVDRGNGIAELFINKFVLPRLLQIKDVDVRDPKSALQELAQDRWRRTPEYRVLQESGPDHARRFVVAVYIGNKPVAHAEASSKQDAQLNAARKALKDSFNINLAVWDELQG